MKINNQKSRHGRLGKEENVCFKLFETITSTGDSVKVTEWTVDGQCSYWTGGRSESRERIRLLFDGSRLP